MTQVSLDVYHIFSAVNNVAKLRTIISSPIAFDYLGKQTTGEPKKLATSSED